MNTEEKIRIQQINISMWRGGVSEYLCEYCVLYVKQFLCGVLFSHDEQFLHSKTQLECVAREQIEKNTKKKTWTKSKEIQKFTHRLKPQRAH